MVALTALFLAAAACGGGEQADESGQAPAAGTESTPAAAAAPAGAVDVTQDQLKAAPEQFVGRSVRITNQRVAVNVGTKAFFLDFPQSPFLVKLDETLIQQGQPLPTGNVNVAGSVRAMNDSIMKDWLAKGYITAGDQLLVEFATHFIEARVVEPGTTSPAP